jgi:hypothetical protein
VLGGVPVNNTVQFYIHDIDVSAIDVPSMTMNEIDNNNMHKQTIGQGFHAPPLYFEIPQVPFQSTTFFTKSFLLQYFFLSISRDG